MRKDKYHIEMEDISSFQVERSEDYRVWEEISTEEMEKVLDSLPEEKQKLFLSVIRNGSPFKLGDLYYKILPL